MTEIPLFAPSPDILASEQVVAGAAMTSAAAADALGSVVTADAFRDGRAGLVFAATLSLAASGEPVDPVAVMARLRQDGTLGRAGGPVYLHDCLAAGEVPNAAWHARRVAEDARRVHAARVMTSALQALESPAFDPDEDFARLRDLVEDALLPPASQARKSAADLVGEVFTALEQEQQRGLPTGITDLDRLLNGLAPGELILVAARPGVGKSVLTAGIAGHAAQAGVPVLLESLEMSGPEIMTRLMSSRARIPLFTLLRRELTDAEMDRVVRAGAELAELPLVIDDTPGTGLAGIRARLREMARTTPAGLVVVDYLQLLDAPAAESRHVAVSALSRGLKLIAREFGIPVVAAAQLNRGPEQRSDKRPQMSDLRESGSLEADADVVILLHREDAYDRESARAGEIDLIVDKNRQGPKSTITAAFQGHYARIVDIAPLTWSPSSTAPEAGAA